MQGPAQAAEGQEPPGGAAAETDAAEAAADAQEPPSAAAAEADAQDAGDAAQEPPSGAAAEADAAEEAEDAGDAAQEPPSGAAAEADAAEAAEGAGDAAQEPPSAAAAEADAQGAGDAAQAEFDPHSGGGADPVSAEGAPAQLPPEAGELAHAAAALAAAAATAAAAAAAAPATAAAAAGAPPATSERAPPGAVLPLTPIPGDELVHLDASTGISPGSGAHPARRGECPPGGSPGVFSVSGYAHTVPCSEHRFSPPNSSPQQNGPGRTPEASPTEPGAPPATKSSDSDHVLGPCMDSGDSEAGRNPLATEACAEDALELLPPALTTVARAGSSAPAAAAAADGAAAPGAAASPAPTDHAAEQESAGQSAVGAWTGQWTPPTTQRHDMLDSPAAHYVEPDAAAATEDLGDSARHGEVAVSESSASGVPRAVSSGGGADARARQPSSPAPSSEPWGAGSKAADEEADPFCAFGEASGNALVPSHAQTEDGPCSPAVVLSPMPARNASTGADLAASSRSHLAIRAATFDPEREIDVVAPTPAEQGPPLAPEPAGSPVTPSPGGRGLSAHGKTRRRMSAQPTQRRGSMQQGSRGGGRIQRSTSQTSMTGSAAGDQQPIPVGPRFSVCSEESASLAEKVSFRSLCSPKSSNVEASPGPVLSKRGRRASRQPITSPAVSPNVGPIQRVSLASPAGPLHKRHSTVSSAVKSPKADSGFSPKAGGHRPSVNLGARNSPPGGPHKSPRTGAPCPAQAVADAKTRLGRITGSTVLLQHRAQHGRRMGATLTGRCAVPSLEELAEDRNPPASPLQTGSRRRSVLPPQADGEENTDKVLRKGRRVAVVVGLSRCADRRTPAYPDTINDVGRVAALLHELGFRVELLHDGLDPAENPRSQPTRDNILECLRGARQGLTSRWDCCLFFYQGFVHGGALSRDTRQPPPRAVGGGQATGAEAIGDLNLFTQDSALGQDLAVTGKFITLQELGMTDATGPFPFGNCVIVDGASILGGTLGSTVPYGCAVVSGRDTAGSRFKCAYNRGQRYPMSYYFRKALQGVAVRDHRVTPNTLNVYLERKLRQRGCDVITNASTLTVGDLILCDRADFGRKYERKMNKDRRVMARDVPAWFTIVATVDNKTWGGLTPAFSQALARRLHTIGKCRAAPQDRRHASRKSRKSVSAPRPSRVQEDLMPLPKDTLSDHGVQPRGQIALRRYRLALDGDAWSMVYAGSGKDRWATRVRAAEQDLIAFSQDKHLGLEQVVWHGTVHAVVWLRSDVAAFQFEYALRNDGVRCRLPPADDDDQDFSECGTPRTVATRYGSQRNELLHSLGSRVSLAATHPASPVQAHDAQSSAAGPDRSPSQQPLAMTASPLLPTPLPTRCFSNVSTRGRALSKGGEEGSMRGRHSPRGPSAVLRCGDLDILEVGHDLSLTFMATDYICHKVDRALRTGELAHFFSHIHSFSCAIFDVAELGEQGAAALLVQAVWRGHRARRTQWSRAQVELQERKARAEFHQLESEIAEDLGSRLLQGARGIVVHVERTVRADKELWEAEERAALLRRMNRSVGSVEQQYRAGIHAAEELGAMQLWGEGQGRWLVEREYVQYRYFMRRAAKLQIAELAGRDKLMRQEKQNFLVIVRQLPRRMQKEMQATD